MRQYNINDIVKTKKPHPCGGFVWKIVRFGSDVKIECQKCKHIVMLDLEAFDKRVKSVINNDNGNNQ